MKQSGGYIWAESEPGQGTTFSIYLPLSEGAAGAVVAASSAVLGVNGNKGEVVLVAEDETAVRTLAARALRDAGFSVLTAASGEAALTLLTQHRGPLHAVVADVVMPLMGGPELASHLALLYPQVPVLFMTGYFDLIGEGQELAPIRRQILTKPFTPETLVQRVQELLAGAGQT